MKRCFFLFALFFFSLPTFLYAQSDSSSFSPPLSPETVLALSSQHPTAFLDSSETIWGELLTSLFQDTTLLSDTERALFVSVAQSLDSVFQSSLLAARQRLSNPFLPSATNRLALEQARLADTMLTFYDSLTCAFEALRATSSTRHSRNIDYKVLLEHLLEKTTPTHRFSFSTAYQSRSVWRGIEQNSGKGTYSLSGLYQHWSGVFLSASVLGLQGQPHLIDQASASLGLDYQPFDNLLVSLAYTRYHYSDSSVQVRSTIHSDLTLWLSFQTEWLTPSVTLIWAIGENTNDFFCAWEISRAFFIGQFSSGRFILLPSISAEYGTISIIRALTRRTGRNSEPQTRIERSSPFVLTNYTFSLSLLYRIGNISIAPEFLFVVPINVSSLTLTAVGSGNFSRPITRTFEQGGKSFGYFSVQVSYSL